MFPKLALFVVSAVALLAAAAPGGLAADDGECDTGPVQCCQSVHQPTSSAVSSRLVHAGLEARNLKGMVGLDCGPSSIIGVGGGTSCSTAPMCCDNNTFSGLIVIGCTPIGVNL